MALEKLNFTKDWSIMDSRSAGYFPTTEFSEAQVRADMQLLHDETKAAFNKLIDDLDASEVPFTPISNVDCSDVQSAIAQVQTNLEQTVFGDLDLPDSSIETQYLADGAVTTSKLGDGAATADKIATGAVTDGKIGALAVGTANIKNGAVTADKIATAFKNSKADLVSDGLSGYLVPGSQMRFKVKTPTVTGSSGYELQLSDAGTIIYPKNSAEGNIEIPPNSRTAFPVGTIIPIIRGSGGELNINTTTPVKLYFAGQTTSTSIQPRIPTRYGMMVLFKVDTNTWWAFLGDTWT